MKKMIALFLALAMVIPMLPVPIFADDSPQEQSSVEETVETAENHSEEDALKDAVPTETESEETELNQDFPENDEVEDVQSGNLYNDWADEQLLEEYIRLTEAADDEALDAFLAALSPEQQTALMALFTATMQDTPATLEEASLDKCGDDLTWSLDENGVLTISGTGNMYDYFDNLPPWFEDSERIKEIHIDAGVTRIGCSCFYMLNSVNSVSIPSGVRQIGVGAFESCSNLTTITIPDTVTSISDYAFSECESITDIYFEGTKARWEIVNIDPNGNDYFIDADVHFASEKDTIAGTCGKSVRWELDETGTLFIYGSGKMENDASRNAPWHNYRDQICRIIIGNGVTSIGDFAFRHCSNLNEIAIPDSVSQIGKYAFMDCGSLLQIHLPNSVQEIGNQAFYNSGLLRISIPGSVRSLGTELFLRCETISEIVIEDGVEKIGSDVFYGAAFKKMYLPASLTYIADDSFGDGDLFLKRVNYDNIPIYYAGSVEQWETLTASNSIISQLPIWIEGTLYPGKHIHESQYPLEGSCGDDAHYSLDENGILVISGSGAMWDFDGDHPVPWSVDRDNIRQVIIEEGITEVGNRAFYMCTINDLQLADSITRIGAEAFYGVPYHTVRIPELKLPKNLKRIEKDAFFGLEHTSTVFMYDQLDEICDGAFGDSFKCAYLEKVIYSGTEEQWNAIKIGDNNFNLKNCAVYVNGGTDKLPQKCSETVFYSISNGVLTISGDGEVPDYGDGEFVGPRAPWIDKAAAIHAVVIEEGIAYFNIGVLYFTPTESITLSLPASLKKVGNMGLSFDQRAISKIIYGGTVDQWNQIIFDENTLSVQKAPRIIQGVEYPQTGSCGSSINYTLTSDGTLTLTGTGAMENYPASVDSSYAPWGDNSRAINNVVIEEGITTIGDGAFGACGRMKSISIPNTIESIGQDAFLGCGLTEITIPENVRSLGYAAFQSSGITILHLPLSLERIESNCFSLSPKIQKIYYPGDESQWNAISVGPWNPWLYRAEIIYNAVEEDNCKHEQATHVEEQPSTCTENGVQEHYECVSCGIWFVDVSTKDEIVDHDTLTIPASGHYESIDEAAEATCTENGKTAGSHCSVCGTVLIAQEPIKATGHSFTGEWQKNADGHWRKCTRCNAESEIEAHTPNIAEATANQNKECTACGYVIQPMQAHKHTLKRVSAKSATCTEAGNKAYYICDCGKMFDTSLQRREITDQSSIITPALGHNWANASCTEPKHCKRNGCGAVEGEALGHIPSDWKHDLVSHWKSCTRSGCGKQLEKADHIDRNNDQRCDICEYSWKNTTVLRSIAVNIVNIFRSIWR